MWMVEVNRVIWKKLIVKEDTNLLEDRHANEIYTQMMACQSIIDVGLE